MTTLQPYVYIATGKSRDVSRVAPTGARVAIHYPELGRSIELWTDERGRWALRELPAPGMSGPEQEIATGQLTKEG